MLLGPVVVVVVVAVDADFATDHDETAGFKVWGFVALDNDGQLVTGARVGCDCDEGATYGVAPFHSNNPP